jgi:hypothetical protein
LASNASLIRAFIQDTTFQSLSGEAEGLAHWAVFAKALRKVMPVDRSMVSVAKTVQTLGHDTICMNGPTVAPRNGSPKGSLNK